MSAKKLARNGYYALFNQERIVFVDSKSKRPLVEVEARNRLYIILKISKEADSRCFKTVTNRPNIRKASSNQDGGDIKAFSTQINGQDNPKVRKRVSFTKTLHITILSNRFNTLVVDDSNKYQDDPSDNESELDNKLAKVEREAIPTRIPRREKNRVIRRTRKPSSTNDKQAETEILDSRTKPTFILKEKRR